MILYIEKNISPELFEIKEKSSVSLIEGIMMNIVKTIEDEKKREEEFIFYIDMIYKTKYKNMFGVKTKELRKLIDEIFKYDRNSKEIGEVFIQDMCFEDKLIFYGLYKRWLKAYSVDENIKNITKEKDNNYVEHCFSGIGDENINKLKNFFK
jgi:hypothetical protein